MANISKSPLNSSLSKQFLNNTNAKTNNNLLISSPLKNNNINNNSVIINNNSEMSNPLLNQDKESTTIQNDNFITFDICISTCII